MTTTQSPSTTSTETDRDAHRALVREAGLRRLARRRAVARSLRNEFTASEADFARWVTPARPTRE